MVQFSENGHKMAAVAIAEINKAEEELKQHLGAENVQQLRRILELKWPDD